MQSQTTQRPSAAGRTPHLEETLVNHIARSRDPSGADHRRAKTSAQITTRQGVKQTKSTIADDTHGAPGQNPAAMRAVGEMSFDLAEDEHAYAHVSGTNRMACRQ